MGALEAHGEWAPTKSSCIYFGFSTDRILTDLSVSLVAWEKLRVTAGVSAVLSTGSNTPEVVANVGSQDEMKFFPCTLSIPDEDHVLVFITSHPSVCGDSVLLRTHNL